jgi:uncharacterized protein
MEIRKLRSNMKSNPSQFSHLKDGLTALREKRYFDAHEDWEIAWKEMKGDRKLFLQAMIQLSVGAYHYTNENRTGCGNLWKKALTKCNRILENSLLNDSGIVTELKDILEECLEVLAQNNSPLRIVERAANNIISDKWLNLMSS